jgi:colicin import membrane protein
MLDLVKKGAMYAPCFANGQKFVISVVDVAFLLQQYSSDKGVLNKRISMSGRAIVSASGAFSVQALKDTCVGLAGDQQMWRDMVSDPTVEREFKAMAMKELSRITTVKASMVAIVSATQLNLESAKGFCLAISTYAAMPPDAEQCDKDEAWKSVTCALKNVTTELCTISADRVVAIRADIEGRMKASAAEIEERVQASKLRAQEAERKAVEDQRRDAEAAKRDAQRTQQEVERTQQMVHDTQRRLAEAEQAAADTQRKLAEARRAGTRAELEEELRRAEIEEKQASARVAKSKADAANAQAIALKARASAADAEAKRSEAQKRAIDMETAHQKRTIFGRTWAFIAGKK